MIVVLYSPKPEIAHFLFNLLPYKDDKVNTSDAVSKSSSPEIDLSSNFTHPKLRLPEFLQKKPSSIKLAKPFTVIPILAAFASGAFLAYQLLKPDKLAPIVPNAPTL